MYVPMYLLLYIGTYITFCLGKKTYIVSSKKRVVFSLLRSTNWKMNHILFEKNILM